MAKSYSAKDITVLEGLEPVRKRPAMYIGGVGKEGLHHLVWEIVDNAVDEAMNGYATRVEVALRKDGRTVSVEDDGRGIPVDTHPDYDKPAVEIVLTTLHSGGKFDRESYLHSGGLHGVGASVVNALSEKLTVTVRRDGQAHRQSFARGKATSKLKVVEKNVKGSGTTVEFQADPEIFPSTQLDSELVRKSLEDRSYLHPGIKFVFHDEKTGESATFREERGIASLLEKSIEKSGLKTTAQPFHFKRDEDPRLAVSLAWTDATDERLRSYVNGIHTTQGGTHETGLRSAVGKAVRDYIETHDVKTPGVKITAEDIREGVVAVVSLFMLEPQFQGQTKSRLNNPEIQTAVEAAVRPALERWLNENKSVADAVLARVVLAARARAASREAAEAVTKKQLGRRLDSPDKLVDCSSRDPEKRELFIVEGQSAGGTVRKGRNGRTQAYLPIRGKVLNAEQATLAKVLENKELKDIVDALGCGIAETFKADHLRYGKIILLMDADSDGDHIATLLLTFFFRYLPGLLRMGAIFIAKPPLFRIVWGKETHWAANEAERDAILARLPKNAKPDVSRFKGLGEMNPSVLAETTLDPEKRTLVRVELKDEPESNKTVMELMGKDVQARFDFIMTRAGTLDDVDV